jgi:outer membrane protein assembly factor BamB
MVLSLCWLVAEVTFAQEWTRFRGPNGTGISHAKTVPTKISDTDLNWKIELPGPGHSSPVLWGEKLFITSAGENGGFFALCYSAKDGTLLWSHEFPLRPFSKHKFNSFASSTPAVDAERVYMVWNEPERFMLVALTHDGKQVWQRDLGPFVSQHGSGISPILYNDKIILGNEQDERKADPRHSTDGKSFLIALEAKTGKTVWKTPRKNVVVAYSTPCVYEPKNRAPELIFNSQGHGIYSVDPDTGKVLWEYDKAFDKRSVSSPIVAGDIIYGSCGSGGGGNFVTAVKAGDASRGIKPQFAYDLKKSAPYVPTGVALGDLVWLWSDGGIVTCLHAPTGEMRYQERVGGSFFGSPVWIDGRLFCVSTAGELAVIDASDKFQVLHRYALNELCHSTPAVALGRLFVRTEKHLWSFGGPAAERKRS